MTAGLERARDAVRWLWNLLGSRGAPSRADGVPVPADASPSLTDAPLDVLAAKVLFSHLRNRQQLLGPPPTAFGQLDEGQTELLIHAAIAAAYAGGRLDATEERQLRGALSSFGLQSDGRGFIDAAIKRPRPLEALLREVRDPHMASLFYAASLTAIDKHDEVNRAYRAYLAARLKLPPDVLARLHSQFGFAAAG